MIYPTKIKWIKDALKSIKWQVIVTIVTSHQINNETPKRHIDKIPINIPTNELSHTTKYRIRAGAKTPPKFSLFNPNEVIPF